MCPHLFFNALRFKSVQKRSLAQAQIFQIELLLWSHIRSSTQSFHLAYTRAVSIALWFYRDCSESRIATAAFETFGKPRFFPLSRVITESRLKEAMYLTFHAFHEKIATIEWQRSRFTRKLYLQWQMRVRQIINEDRNETRVPNSCSR